MVPARRRHTALIRIWFDADDNSNRAQELARAACVLGETVDLSRTGVGFIVPSIRVKEKYLVGQERSLNIEIDLPTGKVRMTAMGRRYEKVGIHISTERFIVGAHILSLEGTDKENYELFLRNGNRRSRTHAASRLELGID